MNELSRAEKEHIRQKVLTDWRSDGVMDGYKGYEVNTAERMHYLEVAGEILFKEEFCNE